MNNHYGLDDENKLQLVLLLNFSKFKTKSKIKAKFVSRRADELRASSSSALVRNTHN